MNIFIIKTDELDDVYLSSNLSDEEISSCLADYLRECRSDGEPFDAESMLRWLRSCYPKCKLNLFNNPITIQL